MRRILASIALGAALTWGSLAPAAAHHPPSPADGSCGLGVWGARLGVEDSSLPDATEIATIPPDTCQGKVQAVRPIPPVGPIW